MSEVASAFLYPPFPFLLLLVAGLALRRFTHFRHAGRRTATLAVVMLVLSVVPLTAKLALLPMLHAVPRWHEGLQVGAIVVPTGGAFEDIGGRWHPSHESVQRVGLAATMQEKLGIPLLITGGNIRKEGVSEARIVAETLGLEPDHVWFDESARNTHENALVLADRLSEMKVDRIMMVTSLSSMPRMAASLRANGLNVYAMPVPAPAVERFGWRDIVPSNHGLALATTASKVYGGLALYLVRGWISPADLVGQP